MRLWNTAFIFTERHSRWQLTLMGWLWQPWMAREPHGTNTCLGETLMDKSPEVVWRIKNSQDNHQNISKTGWLRSAVHDGGSCTKSWWGCLSDVESVNWACACDPRHHLAQTDDFQKQVEVDMPCMLPEVEAALVEWGFQEVGAPEVEPEAETSKVPEQETSVPEDDEEEEETVSQAEEPTQWEGEQTHYMSRVGKLLHMMCWSRQEIYNAVRNCQGTWKQGQCISMSIPWRGSWINAWPKGIEDWS